MGEEDQILCAKLGWTGRLIRQLSIPEIKALASYPVGFQFVGTYRQRWARVGNSVPPLLMKAIADSIRWILAARIGD